MVSDYLKILLLVVVRQKWSKLSLRWKLRLWENEILEQRAEGATTCPSTLWELHHTAVCWVDLSVEAVSIDALEVLCEGCRVLYASWLLETPTNSLTLQSDYKGLSSAEEKLSLVPLDWGLRCAQRMGHWEGWGWGSSLGSSSCASSHPFDKFGVGYRKGLDAFKVGLLPLNPLPGGHNIAKPVPLALHWFVKEIWHVEFKVVSVSKRQSPGTRQQFRRDRRCMLSASWEGSCPTQVNHRWPRFLTTPFFVQGIITRQL